MKWRPARTGWLATTQNSSESETAVRRDIEQVRSQIDTAIRSYGPERRRWAARDFGPKAQNRRSVRSPQLSDVQNDHSTSRQSADSAQEQPDC